ncbi:MAG: chemotaxis protein CheX [Gemmatimonadota bacterium]|nr:chemotaxis protein CheX [Gemmatimonadota bacterium]
MNDTTQLDLFGECIFSVLETMTFIMADIITVDEIVNDPGPCLEARMSFSGEKKGHVLITTQYGLGEELALNMLGTEKKELSDREVKDALREILNMTCGQYLTGRFGQDPVFDLTVPEVREIDINTWQEQAKSEDYLLIDAEGHQMMASIKAED